MLLAMVKVQEAELESKGYRRSGVLGDDQGWCAESCGFFPLICIRSFPPLTPKPLSRCAWSPRNRPFLSTLVALSTVLGLEIGVDPFERCLRLESFLAVDMTKPAASGVSYDVLAL